MAPTQDGAMSPMAFIFEYKRLRFYHAEPEGRFTHPGIHVWVPDLRHHVQCLVETDDHKFLPVGVPQELKDIAARLDEVEKKK